METSKTAFLTWIHMENSSSFTVIDVALTCGALGGHLHRSELSIDLLRDR
jgi:hypothetical protein